MADIVTKQALQGAVNELVEKLKPIVITPYDFSEMWFDDRSAFVWNEPEDEYFQNDDLGSYMSFSYVPPGFIINGNLDSLSELYDRIKEACMTRQGFTLALMGEIGCVLLQHDFSDISSQGRNTRFKPILNPITGEFFVPVLVFDESQNHRSLIFNFGLMNLLPAVPPRDNCLYGIKNGKYVKITDPDQVLVVTSRPEEPQAAMLAMDEVTQDAPGIMSLEATDAPEFMGIDLSDGTSFESQVAMTEEIKGEDSGNFTEQSDIKTEDYE